MTSRFFAGSVMFASVLLLAACGEQAVETPAADEHHNDAVHDGEAPSAILPRSSAPEGASVFFISPVDGDTVNSPLLIEFGIQGMTVVAAGVNEENSGHHHLLVDTALPDSSMPIPADANHIHFGDGRTATELELDPGEHTLQLLLGDHLHIPHEPPVASAVITVFVE